MGAVFRSSGTSSTGSQRRGGRGRTPTWEEVFQRRMGARSAARSRRTCHGKGHLILRSGMRLKGDDKPPAAQAVVAASRTSFRKARIACTSQRSGPRAAITGTRRSKDETIQNGDPTRAEMARKWRRIWQRPAVAADAFVGSGELVAELQQRSPFARGLQPEHPRRNAGTLHLQERFPAVRSQGCSGWGSKDEIAAAWAASPTSHHRERWTRRAAGFYPSGPSELIAGWRPDGDRDCNVMDAAMDHGYRKNSINVMDKSSGPGP